MEYNIVYIYEGGKEYLWNDSVSLKIMPSYSQAGPIIFTLWVYTAMKHGISGTEISIIYPVPSWVLFFYYQNVKLECW